MSTAFEAPEDPRASWDLPSFGDMPVVTALNEIVTRVLAPNPSPMALDGTNTYVIGRPGGADAVVVDPGPLDASHIGRIAEVVEDLDVAVHAVFVTHHHLDHSEAAFDVAERFDAQVVSSQRVAGDEGRVVGEGDVIRVDGLADLEVVATPGHTRDHLALRLPDGSLLTGDHILGRGTTVVTHPDGDMSTYLESLRKVLRLGPDTLLPGHGPELARDPSAVVEYYLAHRLFREQQILAVLGRGPAGVDDLVEHIYADVDRGLWPAAASSTKAALDSMLERDLVVRDGSRYALMTDV